MVIITGPGGTGKYIMLSKGKGYLLFSFMDLELLHFTGGSIELFVIANAVFVCGKE